MKSGLKKLKAIVFRKSVVIILISFASMSFVVLLSATNPAAAKTGSPADGVDCTDCHTEGTGVTAVTSVTSNIPGGVYVPGNTYTVTVSISEAGKSKWGFELSAQTPAGAQVGTLVANANTQIVLGGVGNCQYITHNAGSNSGAGSKSWTFTWIAPATAGLPFKFYAAIMAADNNGGDTGNDEVYRNNIVIAGVAEKTISDFAINLFPNPSTKNFNVELNSLTSEDYSINVTDLTGKTVYSEVFSASIGKNIKSVSLSADGIYNVQLSSKNGVQERKTAVLK